MTDLVRYVQVKALFERIAVMEDDLAANERELVRELRENYADPSRNDAHAVRALETILRNVEIRKGFDIDPGSHAPRGAIELERKTN